LASLKSKLAELFLRLTDRKKEGLYRYVKQLAAEQSTEEIGRASIGSMLSRGSMLWPDPPQVMYKRFAIDKRKASGHNVFTLSRTASAGQYHILFLHGGAYVKTFYKQHWQFLGRLAGELDCSVTAPDYPLPPKHTYKDAFAMILPIYKELASRVNPENLTVMGDSAGGGMGLALAQKLREENIPQPGNIILLSPWLDITLTNPDIAEADRKDPMLSVRGLIEAGKMYAGDGDPSDYLISPINCSLSGLGRITVFIGTHDLLIADCRRLRANAEAEGVDIDYYEYEDMMHAWVLLSFPESTQAMKQIAERIKGRPPRAARTGF
jgi:acetyl esterase/lipase